MVVYYTIFRSPGSEDVRSKLFKILDGIASRDETFWWGTTEDGV